MITSALKWIGGADGFLELVDQRKLPARLVKVQCRDVEGIYEAIKTLSVRGAPAIGVCSAYGLVLGIQRLSAGENLNDAIGVLERTGKYLTSSRPTAVNLFWAVDRVLQSAGRFISQTPKADMKGLKDAVFGEADAICREDVEMCLAIGRNGERFIREGCAVLTHCNAGSLATAGQGTALSVLFEAHKKGRHFRVYADETRPLLQGARLTAWELKEAGIDTVVICDNTAGFLMKQKRIDMVITGADRIAANGDTANKIGTYGLSVLAKEHKIPFYVAAPSSTFDLKLKDGSGIPIEERAAQELSAFGGTQITPDGVGVYNPAFDITDASLITAIITEKGVIERPCEDNILSHLERV
jgi:methylthioribose-1-phosphate isomerase